MKKNFTIILMLIFFGVSSAFTQVVASLDISHYNIDLANTTTLGQLTINPTEAGQVIVHFDGFCISDDGDLIALAASNTTSWEPFDGLVVARATDPDVNRNSFSHTRVYNVTAGSYTFYALAQNRVDTAGTGIASIYGNLTAKFIPSGASYLAGFQAINIGDIDLANETTVGLVTINPSEAGKVIVRFDGRCHSDVGDRIYLAASNITSWGVNDGSVSVEAVSAIKEENSFSHTRVYDVAAGSHTFCAVAQNFGETDGSGIASIYGSLTVEFIPAASNYLVGFQGISQTAIDLANTTTLGQVTINPTIAGKVIVHFDGRCISDVGDRINIAASNSTMWGVDNGSVSVEASDADVNRKPFSHTRGYNITAGSHTFYAVAQNFAETDGSGIASIDGSLTVAFFPNAGASVESNMMNPLQIYPNPATTELFVSLPNNINANLNCKIYNMCGVLCHEIILTGINTNTIDISRLSQGVYSLVLSGEKDIYYSKFVKNQ